DKNPSVLGSSSCAFFCASFESITAIEKLGKWWDCQLGNYTWGSGDSGGGGDVLPKGL
ncbi:hypothetical protein Tco_1559582, partial [Tanacetum coccineum]